ncbi:MAG: nitrilase-related carbon-nitrogen hydrolase [Pseudomonadota bacterium]
MDDLRIAAVCMHAPLGEVEKNLDRIESLVSEASGEGASIVCFPELSVTGYTLKPPAEVYQGPDADTIMDRLVELAREAHLVLIAGLIEVSDVKKPYITQVIAGPEGLIGLYRKTHLSPAEKRVYQAGQNIEVYNFGNTTFGVALCYETHFPEISAVLALMGADILFFPHASPRGDPKGKFQSWMRHLPARAFDNGVFIVACNQVGSNSDGFLFPGVALVLGPDGQILAKYTGREERIIFADLKADYLEDVRLHRMKYFIPQRRPGLYTKIVEDYPG